MTENKVGFALVGIKTEQFATFEENFSGKAKIGLKTGLEFQFNNDDKLITVFATVNFGQSKRTFLKLQVSCHFKISDDAYNTFYTDSKITFPKGFMTHLAMITVSSARGVLHAKTENTPFNKFILPTIDVTEIVNEDVEFTIDQ